MTWWQWLILCGGLVLTIPISLLMSRLLDKLDVDYGTVNDKEDDENV